MVLPDLTNYLLFVRVVEAGSIGAAARDLGMPKSTLSRRLTELEKAQGVRLLHRSTRGLKLTDIGQAFLVHCQAMVSAAESAQQVTQEAQEVPRGEVHLSSPYALSQSLLNRLLPDFMRLYPEVRVRLTVTNRPINLVDEGVDIALRVRSSIEDSSLIARELGESTLTLYVAPKLLATIGEPTRPEDLKALPQLSLHDSSGRYRYALREPQGEQVTLEFQPRLITDDMIVLRDAAIAGNGVVALPHYLCAEAIDRGDLVRVLADWQLPPGIMHMVYPHRRGLLPAVRALIDFLAERLPETARRALDL